MGTWALRDRLRFAFVLILLCALASCGGGADKAVLPGTGTEDPRLREALWTALEEEPGIAGQDYDPSRIMLVYRPSATLPTGWTAARNPVAALQPNPQLRSRPGLEALSDAIAERYGLTIRRQVYIGSVNFASFDCATTGDKALLQRIRSEAASVLESAIFVPLKQASYVPNDPDFASGSFGEQWSHWKVGCSLAWDIERGDSNVMIAVVDTGVRLSHEELSTTVLNPATAFPVANCDVVNNDKSMEDLDGHGTFIAGMIAAQQDNGRTISGVAPGCRVLPVKVSNVGDAMLDDLIAGALLAGQLGASAVNYSWGGSDNIPIEEDMVDSLTGDGVLFVCAAGNDGTSFNEFPSAFSSALSVGSTNPSDFSSDFSNWGTAVDIAAPGEDLKSCAVFSNSAYDSEGAGTSFAAPMVAAAAGLLWSVDPSLSLSEVRQALVSHGPVAGGFANVIRRLDVNAALLSVVGELEPSITLVLPAEGATIGAVPGKSAVQLSVLGAQNVVRVEYSLDVAPAGEGPEDRQAESTAAGSFAAMMAVEGIDNQAVMLTARYFSAGGNEGSMQSGPLWLFNQRGDVNADGAVDLADLEELSGMMGLSANDAGYRGYADANLDEKINEADAAAVGYYFGTGVIAPEIISVAPLGGITGAELSLLPEIEGGGLLDYSWDFGGGAVPNTSALPAPTVTLGAPGSYNASLTVSSTSGNDHFDFTLEVEARPGPTAVIDASRLTGQPPLAIDFDASASSSPGGSIELYEWSWDGDETYEESGSSPLASHSFDTLGEYTVRLRVTDDEAATATSTADVKVIETVTISEVGTISLGPWGPGNSADDMRIGAGEIAGRPAVAWIRMGGLQDDECYVAVAMVDDPVALEDWRIDVIAEGQMIDGTNSSAAICDIDGEATFIFGENSGLIYGQYSGDSYETYMLPGGARGSATISSIDGKPAVFASMGSLGMLYMYADSSAPDDASDWTETILTDPALKLGSTYSIPYEMLDIGGLPMVQYEGPQSGDWRVCFATSNPPAAGDWKSYTWDGDHTGSEMYGKLFDSEGLPAVLYTIDDGNDENLFFSKALDQQPDQAGDWTTYNFDPDAPRVRVAGTVDGLPAFLVFTGTYIALNSSPQGPEDWQHIPFHPDYDGRRMVSHGGFPAFFGVRDGNVQYRYPIF